MLTRERFRPPKLTGDPARDAQMVLRAVDEYLRSLEQKDALAINEVANWTPIDGSGAGLAFTVNAAKVAVGLGRVYGRLEIAYPVTANPANSAIAGLPFTMAGNVACPMLCTAAGGYTIALATGSGFLPATAAGGRVTNAQLSGATIYISFQYDIA